METKYVENAYQAKERTSQELFNSLAIARDDNYHFVIGYMPTGGGQGKIYHMNGCTIRINNGRESAFPVVISGDEENVREAASRLEELSGISMKKCL